MSDPVAYICPQCQIGHLQPGNETFIRVYGGMIVSIPDMLCFTCDVCGFQEFDRASVAHVEALVGDGRAGRAVPRAAAKSPSPEGNASPSLKR